MPFGLAERHRDRRVSAARAGTRRRFSRPKREQMFDLSHVRLNPTMQNYDAT